MSSERSSTSKVRDFQSGVTVQFAVLMGLDLAVAGFLVYWGYHINQTWHHRGDFFMVFGAGVVAAAFVLWVRSRDATIRLTDSSFTYTHGSKSETFLWGEMRIYRGALVQKGIFRSMVVGDSRRLVRIDRIAFPEYDVIANVIRVAVKYHRQQPYEIR